jgi:hypothetical protein
VLLKRNVKKRTLLYNFSMSVEFVKLRIVNIVVLWSF